MDGECTFEKLCEGCMNVLNIELEDLESGDPAKLRVWSIDSEDERKERIQFLQAMTQSELIEYEVN